jgi:hypothetical protein
MICTHEGRKRKGLSLWGTVWRWGELELICMTSGKLNAERSGCGDWCKEKGAKMNSPLQKFAPGRTLCLSEGIEHRARLLSVLFDRHLPMSLRLLSQSSNRCFPVPLPRPRGKPRNGDG